MANSQTQPRDVLQHDLHLLLVGHNPSFGTTSQQYPYSQPTNHFWSLLKASGITPTDQAVVVFDPDSELGREAVYGEPLPLSATPHLPAIYNVGLAEICKVPTTEAATRLPKQLKEDGVIHLEWKIAKYKPEVVGIVGKEAWKAIFNIKMGRTLRDDEFHYGWQDEALWMGRVEDGKVSITVEENRTNQNLETEVEPDLMADVAAGIDWVGAYVFVLPDSSIRFAEVSKLEKTGSWIELGDWIQERRVEDAESEDEHQMDIS